MGEDNITVGVISWYSADQIKVLFESLIANASQPEKITFIICDNTGGKDIHLHNQFDNYCLILNYEPVIPLNWRPRRAKGSYAHGLGLNFLMSQIHTEYCLFSDPDCFVFAKSWDLKLKSLIDNKHIAVGAPYHSSKIVKYHNFPSPIFSFFKTAAFKEIKADWVPYRLPINTLITDQLRRIPGIVGGYLGSKIWGRSFYLSKTAELLRILFGNSGKDTGWRISQAARKKGYSARLLTSAITSQQLAYPFSEDNSVIALVNEYELFLLDGMPFLTHLYSSKKRGKGGFRDEYERWRSLACEVTKLQNS